MQKVLAVVLSLLVVGSQAQLDSCEGCLSTIGTLASYAATPESIDRQLELLISTECLEAGPECEDNFRTYWPGATIALYGPDHVDYTVHELCKLASHCNVKRFSKSNLGEYADCGTCEADLFTLGELYHHHNTIAHLDREIKKFYCDVIHGPEHKGCIHFVHTYAPTAFKILGDYMGASAGELCQDVFDCPATTDGPTEEPTTMAAFEV